MKIDKNTSVFRVTWNGIKNLYLPQKVNLLHYLKDNIFDYFDFTVFDSEIECQKECDKLNGQEISVQDLKNHNLKLFNFLSERVGPVSVRKRLLSMLRYYISFIDYTPNEIDALTIKELDIEP